MADNTYIRILFEHRLSEFNLDVFKLFWNLDEKNIALYFIGLWEFVCVGFKETWREMFRPMLCFFGGTYLFGDDESVPHIISVLRSRIVERYAAFLAEREDARAEFVPTVFLASLDPKRRFSTRHPQMTHVLR